MTSSTVHLTECPNCGASLDGAFCAKCGQKASALNPSIGEFLHDLVHELAHVDGKIVQSRTTSRPSRRFSVRPPSAARTRWL